MKLYRVLPDTYTYKNNKITVTSFYGHDTYLEGIYNKSGLTSLELDINHGSGGNSYGEKLKEPSKYFFVFPEDAINCAYILIPHCNFARIAVYDIPDEIALQNIGVGQYRGDFAIETAVGVSNFEGKRYRYFDVPDEKHKDLIISYLKDTLDMYKFVTGDNLSLNNEDISKMYDKDSLLDVLNYDCNSILTRSTFFTGDIFPFARFWNGISFDKLHQINIEYLKERGLSLDYSEEACKERASLLENLKDFPDGFYIPICAFRDNDIIRERVRNYFQTH